MLLIWGFRSKTVQLAILTYLCNTCHNPAAHPLRKVVRKFTLFFIPLFLVSTKYYTQCTFCGAATQLSKEQADQALLQAAPVAPLATPTEAAIPSPEQSA